LDPRERKIQGAEKIQNKELHDLYSTSGVTEMIK
jgi:hypothetical protein